MNKNSGTDLFYSKLDRADLADMLYDIKVTDLGEDWRDAWAEVDVLEMKGRLALVQAIEAIQR